MRTARCIQWLKDTNLKANHNRVWLFFLSHLAVFNGSKILIWKQITTTPCFIRKNTGCIQWLKDTNLKANHNYLNFGWILILAVFNGSKILIWKQITTTFSYVALAICCIQWLKDTNLKANHNRKMLVKDNRLLYSMAQRY